MNARIARLLVVAGAVIIATACEPGLPPNCMSKGTSGDLRLVLCSEPIFPYAREKTQYRAIIRDAESGEPIENGEGQIYATSRDGINRYDALLPGEEVGTYYGELNYLTAGQWGVAIRFRRDSTQPLWEFHWQQDVRSAREPAFPGDTIRPG
jgi:hypothetical protein